MTNIMQIVLLMGLGFLACETGYWIITSRLWHNLVHRRHVHSFLNNRLVCAHCVDDSEED